MKLNSTETSTRLHHENLDKQTPLKWEIYTEIN